MRAQHQVASIYRNHETRGRTLILVFEVLRKAKPTRQPMDGKTWKRPRSEYLFYLHCNILQTPFFLQQTFILCPCHDIILKPVAREKLILGSSSKQFKKSMTKVKYNNVTNTTSKIKE